MISVINHPIGFAFGNLFAQAILFFVVLGVEYIQTKKIEIDLKTMLTNFLIGVGIYIVSIAVTINSWNNIIIVIFAVIFNFFVFYISKSAWNPRKKQTLISILSCIIWLITTLVCWFLIYKDGPGT